MVRLRVVGAVAAATMAALAGCATPSGPSGASPTDGGQLGGSPSGTASASPGASPSAVASTSAAPTYPKDAKSYSLALLSAWGKRDYNRLDQLAIQSTVQQIRDSINANGIPNTSWSHINCGSGGSGVTVCVFRNAHGDVATIRLNNNQIGFPTAVTEAMLERTEYPSDPGSYAAYFMNAWQENNTHRMARLSSSSIRNYFIGQNPPLNAWGQDTPVDIGGGFSTIQFSGLSSDSGRYFTVKIRNSPGGKANQITDYCKGYNCTP